MHHRKGRTDIRKFKSEVVKYVVSIPTIKRNGDNYRKGNITVCTLINDYRRFKTNFPNYFHNLRCIKTSRQFLCKVTNRNNLAAMRGRRLTGSFISKSIESFVIMI